MTALSPPTGAPLDVGRFLLLLHEQGDVFEVRIPKHGKYKFTASGYFDDVDAAVEAVACWDGKASVYTTLNQINPSLLARAVNKIVERADATTADGDVLRRRWLFLDLDAARPSGISSTDEELAQVQRSADEIAAFLRSRGWPEAIFVASGNGAYLLYRVDLPNDPDANNLVAAVLRSMAGRFDNECVKVDTSVSNAARIIGLVGTMKMKGDLTVDRPHRRSYVVSAPEHLTVVSRAQLEAVAGAQAPKPTLFVVPRSGGRLTDMLDAAGIEYREQSPDANGVTWYHVRQCPLHDDGQPFECGVGQTLPDGPYAGHCFHPEGDGKGWHDFKRALGLDGASGGRDTHDPAMVSPKGLPQICTSDRFRKSIAQDAWSALTASNDPVRFFRHGRGIAELVRDDDDRLLISHLSLPALAGHVDRCADFVKATKTGLMPARPPRDVIEDMDAMEKPLPALRGIVGTPVFAADGTLATDAGYQAMTRLFYEPVGQPVAAVPDRPDETHLRMAKEIILLDWLGDFPFLDDASRANAIAMVITAIAREMVGGPTPLFVVDAPTAGTGKGLLVSGIGNVITGREPPVMSEVRDENELRKRLTAKLYEGAAILVLDNLKRRLDSGTLAALLTAEVWSDRILGVSKSADVPVRNVWICTGNNIQLADEMARRSIWVRLDARKDRPWQGRSFRHPDLKRWLRAHRHELVWAFLVLIQNWIARGRPEWRGEVLGSYEDWCRIVGGVLSAAHVDGFLANREELYARTDAVSEEWRRFVAAWSEAHGHRPAAVGDLVDAARELLPSVFTKMRDDPTDRAVRTRLGKALTEQRDRRFGDDFIRYDGIDKHTKGALWHLEAAQDAEPLDLGTPSSAEVPQDQWSISDSFAEGAEVAEDDPGSFENIEGRLDEEALVREGADSLPHVPHLPRTDSESGVPTAEDARKMPVADAELPQCKRCSTLMDSTASNLCAACRRDALLAVMEGQR